MDPDAIGAADAELADPEAAALGTAEGDGTEIEDPEAVGAGTSRATSSGSLLQTVPALRPMSSWLRRDPHGEEPAGS
jgi:hypothetical protein